MKEQRWVSRAAGCADSTLLHLDVDACRWERLDPVAGTREVILADEEYCDPLTFAAHPTLPRVMAFLHPYDGTKPAALREIDGEALVVRTAYARDDEYVEYGGYDESGRLTYLVREDRPEPGMVKRVIDGVLERDSCALEIARARSLSGSRWKDAAIEPAEACGEPSPLEELEARVLLPATMPGTTTLLDGRRAGPAAEERLNEALARAGGEDAELTTWIELASPAGRIARAEISDGDYEWIAFLDAAGDVIGGPQPDSGDKMRLRGSYLLTTSAYDDSSAKLYDVTTGELLHTGADGYLTTMFWPCPVR